MELLLGIKTAILAAVPVTELRFSIPYAMTVYKLSPLAAFYWSILGSAVCAYVILYLIGPVTDWLRKQWLFFEKIISWIFQRTRNKAAAKYVKYGSWALIIFVAVPLPGSGFWTGALIAFLFGLGRFKAWLLILAGVIISALLMTFGTLGIINLY